MYAILALALLTNYDMIGEACSSPYDMLGPSVKGATNVQGYRDVRVLAYVDLNDIPTLQRLNKDRNSLEGLRLEIRDSSGIPAEGRDYLARRGAKLPLLQYHTDGGWKFSSGWPGAFEFAQRWSRDNTGSEIRVQNQGVQIGSNQANYQSTLGYPIRGSWWTGCGSWRHMTQGEHAGKFDPAWLQSLSNAELQSLHSDDHEHRVKWAYVNKAPAAISEGNSGTKVVRRSFLKTWFGVQDNYCPNGNCPNAR